MTTKADCKTQWHIIVAHLWRLRDWQPTHLLQSRETEFGFIGSSGEQRVRELARNAPAVIAAHPELKDKVERRRGSEIGLDPRYEFFRYKQSWNNKKIDSHNALRAANERCRLFDAGAPAEVIFNV